MPTTAQLIHHWRSRVGRFKEPSFAQANSTLRPEKIDIDKVGHHVSVPFVRGVRTYVFEGQANRDRFINLYRPHGAKPCKDPHP